MRRVCISNDIEVTDIEKEILGNEISRENYDATIYLAWNEKINNVFFDKFKSLRAVVRCGVGYDNVDVKEAQKRGIKVCIIPDYGVHEVAQSAAAFIFAKYRNIYEYNCLSKQNYLSEKWQLPNKSIQRANLIKVGVIGAGRIGSVLIRLCKSFGFDVLFYDPYVSQGYEKVLECKRVNVLNDLLKASDFISIHVPCNNETVGMINKEFLKNMKKGSTIVNTARGNLIEDYKSLEKALDSKEISNVYLDVLKTEPPLRCSFLDKWLSGYYSNRVIINPHTSFYSEQSFEEMRRKACTTAVDILDNKDPYCEVES